MTISLSTKIRAVGGASAFALAAGFSVTAAAQTAPLTSPPTAPTPPTQPANTEQCTETAPDVFTCIPGTDPDGVGEDPTLGDPADPIRININDGAFVTGSTGFASGASVTGDTGTIVVNRGSVVGGANGAVILNDDSAYNNLGWTSSDFVVGIRTGNDVIIRNSGTIYGNSTNGLIAGGNGMVVNNTGLIQNDAGTAIRIAGDGNNTNFAEVINSDTGLIFGLADNASTVNIEGDGGVTNDGLIQSFGDGSIAVEIGGAGTVVNNGNIATIGSDSNALAVGEGSTITNAGLIQTTGDSSEGVNLGNGSLLVNSGTVRTEGDSVSDAITAFSSDGVTVENSGLIETLGENSFGFFSVDVAEVVITNSDTGEITTNGNVSIAVSVSDGNLTLTNAGLIQVLDPGAQVAVGVFNGNLLLDNSGTIQSAGATTIQGDAEVDITNSGVIGADTGVAIDATGVANIFNTDTGVIESGGDNAIQLGANDSRVINNGTVNSDTDSAVFADNTVTGISVANNGTMTGSFATIRAGDDLLVVNRGDLSSANSFAIATSDGFELRNLGSISANGIAVRANDNSTITNSGSIVSNVNTAIRVGGTSTITNEAGGSISGNIGFDGSDGGATTQTVANFGSIVGTGGQAIFFGDGDDEFQQWTGATVDGNVRLGAGDDLFILEGSASSVNGIVAGQAGTDLAILAGILDADNLIQFETYQLGSTLGGTLDDLVISGDRTLDGDVVHTGVVTIGLGTGTLTTSGSITLESTGVLNITTPLDEALLGQTVLVLEAGTTFTDNGATVNIIDDDLLIDYTPVGTLSVQVSAVDPLVASGDPNIVRFSNVVNAAILGSTLDTATFAALNDLPDAASYEAALVDALPSLAEGPGREIFETASASSAALDRHLTGEGSHIWGQFIVRGAEQDALSLTAGGYEADELIFTIGGDVALSEGARVGLIASFADIDIDDLSLKSQEVESIKLGAYVAVDLLERGFFNAEVAYLTGDIETSRGGFFGPITSGFDFDGITGRATLGYDLLADEGVSLTPSIGVNAGRINFDDAVEAGGFGFTVERGDAEYIELRGGIEFGAQVSEMVSGFISGTIIHDTVDTIRSFRLSSSQLDTFFVELPLREQDRFELAAGLDVEVSETFSINVGYMGDFNEGYSAHAARATVSVGF